MSVRDTVVTLPTFVVLNMASQNNEQKEAVNIEHVEQLPDEKEEHVDHVEPTDKFHAMRIDGDEEDHMHEPPWTFSRAMSLIAMGFLWVGSQIPLYLFGIVPSGFRVDRPLILSRFDPTLHLLRYWRVRQ